MQMLAATFMRHSTAITVILFLLVFYGATLIFTDYSLTGFWTDIIFYFTLSLLFLFFSYTNGSLNKLSVITYKVLSTTLLIITICYAIIFLNNFKNWQIFKVVSLRTQNLKDRTFHPYFSPVGSWGRGYGKFWISESPKYFPLIEKTVYFEAATDYDMKSLYFEETPIEEIIKTTIENSILEKKN